MRDHHKLKAFQLADALAVDVYRLSLKLPQTEQFGLAAQMRSAASSVAANIVEGCARHSERDFLRFLDMAYGSARELEYHISLAWRVGLISEADHGTISPACAETCAVLSGLIRALRRP